MSKKKNEQITAEYCKKEQDKYLQKEKARAEQEIRVNIRGESKWVTLDELLQALLAEARRGFIFIEVYPNPCSKPLLKELVKRGFTIRAAYYKFDDTVEYYVQCVYKKDTRFTRTLVTEEDVENWDGASFLKECKKLEKEDEERRKLAEFKEEHPILAKIISIIQSI